MVGRGVEDTSSRIMVTVYSNLFPGASHFPAETLFWKPFCPAFHETRETGSRRARSLFYYWEPGIEMFPELVDETGVPKVKRVFLPATGGGDCGQIGEGKGSYRCDFKVTESARACSYFLSNQVITQNILMILAVNVLAVNCSLRPSPLQCQKVSLHSTQSQTAPLSVRFEVNRFLRLASEKLKSFPLALEIIREFELPADEDLDRCNRIEGTYQLRGKGPSRQYESSTANRGV